MNYRNEIRAVLKENRGKNSAITSGEIRDEVGINDSHDTHPAVRDVIRQLIKEGLPVASSGSGYYVVRNDEELNEYVRSLKSRQNAIQERIDAVAEAYNDSDELDVIVSSVELK